MLEPAQIETWLKEDLGNGDITTEALIKNDQIATADIICKEDGVIYGLEFMDDILSHLGVKFESSYHIKSGQFAQKSQKVASFRTSYATLLKAERTFLNLVQHLSGIASLTHTFVQEVQHTKAKILDTRKTTPGLRTLEKAAVKAGGGHNHRIGLYDQFLIKENHLEAYRTSPNPFEQAISKARSFQDQTFITIETQSIQEVKLALPAKPNVILLDNMTHEDMKISVGLAKAHPEVECEASGGISINSVKRVAETGVHRISIGALTHSAKNLDLSMLIHY